MAPQYEEQPCVLVMSGTVIHEQGCPWEPLYRISKELTDITHTDTSIHFERAVYIKEEEDESIKKEESIEDEESVVDEPTLAGWDRLYNLVHPLNADHRDDIPAKWYMTRASSSLPTTTGKGTGKGKGKGKAKKADNDTVGNILFQTAKSFVMRRTEWTSLCSSGTSDLSSPLFAEDKSTYGYCFKTIRSGPGFYWQNESGKPVAREPVVRNLEDEKPTLTVAEPMSPNRRDALVALWVLRLWFDIAEDPRFKRQAIQGMAPGDAQAYKGMGYAQRAGMASGLTSKATGGGQRWGPGDADDPDR